MSGFWSLSLSPSWWKLPKTILSQGPWATRYLLQFEMPKVDGRRYCKESGGRMRELENGSTFFCASNSTIVQQVFVGVHSTELLYIQVYRSMSCVWICMILQQEHICSYPTTETWLCSTSRQYWRNFTCYKIQYHEPLLHLHMPSVHHISKNP